MGVSEYYEIRILGAHSYAGLQDLTPFLILDSLNASGKMIGIISHVEALKERIPAQIRVEKGGGMGYSRLVV